jgi:hypothetical protein
VQAVKSCTFGLHVPAHPAAGTHNIVKFCIAHSVPFRRSGPFTELSSTIKSWQDSLPDRKDASLGSASLSGRDSRLTYFLDNPMFDTAKDISPPRRPSSAVPVLDRGSTGWHCSWLLHVCPVGWLHRSVSHTKGVLKKGVKPHCYVDWSTAGGDEGGALEDGNGLFPQVDCKAASCPFYWALSQVRGPPVARTPNIFQPYWQQV